MVYDPITRKTYSLHLENVVAEKVTALEPSGRPEYEARAVVRIQREMEIRTFKKAW